MKNLLRFFVLGLALLAVAGCGVSKTEWNTMVGLGGLNTIEILEPTSNSSDFAVRIKYENPTTDEDYLKTLLRQSCPNYEVIEKRTLTFKLNTTRADSDSRTFRFYSIKCGPDGTALE